MIAFMTPESANTPSGANYWYGNGLPHGMAGSLSQDGLSDRLLRGGSEASSVLDPYSVSSNESPGSVWDQDHTTLDLDTSQGSASLMRPTSTNNTSNSHKAPLAPKQGLVGSFAGARPQHQSPISGTYALRTPRGKITSIACESCRKRKSKCDGVRPKCNTCQSKNLSCIYDVAEDGKTTTQLRAHLRRLVKELDDMKSIMLPLATAEDRTIARNWANELEKNGFAHHSADEIRRALQDTSDQHQMQQEKSMVETPVTDTFPLPAHSLGTSSSYDGSSRDESREQSQPAIMYQNEARMGATVPFHFEEATDLHKFSYECALFRRTKQKLLANGWNELRVCGNREIDVDSILLGFTDPQESQPVSTWASRTVSKVLHTSPLPNRLASAYLLTKMMRWLIWPRADNMNDMPEWLMPLSGQDSSSYDILVDLLPWPHVRQHIYERPSDFLVGAFVGFVHLTWPYADDACHYWDIESGCSRLTPVFESHVNDLNSWTLDVKALETMPSIDGMVPIKID